MNAAIDDAVRVALYRSALEVQRLPGVRDLAKTLGLSEAVVDQSLERLANAHIVVRSPDGRVRMAMPFSGEPTAVRVTRNGTSWWANCAWDGLGIPAAIDGGKGHATIEALCGDCGETVRVLVGGGRAGIAAAGPDPVVHFAIPAARWWDDIGFT
jgi:hypothetical protein